MESRRFGKYLLIHLHFEIQFLFFWLASLEKSLVFFEPKLFRVKVNVLNLLPQLMPKINRKMTFINNLTGGFKKKLQNKQAKVNFKLVGLKTSNEKISCSFYNLLHIK